MIRWNISAEHLPRHNFVVVLFILYLFFVNVCFYYISLDFLGISKTTLVTLVTVEDPGDDLGTRM